MNGTIDNILVLRTSWPQKSIYRSDPLDPDTDNDGKIDSREGLGRYSSTVDRDTDNDGFPDKTDLNPDHINPTPWFGMNHVISMNGWEWDDINEEYKLNDGSITRLTMFDPTHMNIIRFDIDVMNDVKYKAGLQPSEEPFFTDCYTIDDTDFCVNIGTLVRLITFTKYAYNNNLWLYPNLVGVEHYDLDGSKEIDYPLKAATFVNVFTKRILQDNPLSYSRIVGWEIENEMNHPFHHIGWSRDKQIELLSKGSSEVRAAEEQAISDSGFTGIIEPRQIIINYHMDLDHMVVENIEEIINYGMDPAESAVEDIIDTLDMLVPGDTFLSYVSDALHADDYEMDKLNYVILLLYQYYVEIYLNDGIFDIIALDFYPCPYGNDVTKMRGWANAEETELTRAVDLVNNLLGTATMFNAKIIFAETGRSTENNLPTFKTPISVGEIFAGIVNGDANRFLTGWDEFWGSENEGDQQDYYEKSIKMFYNYYWDDNQDHFLGVTYYHWKDGIERNFQSLGALVNTEENYGIIDYDGEPKQAYYWLINEENWYWINR